jgi:hypothetical protein
VIVGGFGLGGFVFGLISSHLVNPRQLSVTETGADGRQKYFPPDSEVALSVPYMFNVLGVIYFCFITLGVLLLCEPPEADREKDESRDGETADGLTGR